MSMQVDPAGQPPASDGSTPSYLDTATQSSARIKFMHDGQEKDMTVDEIVRLAQSNAHVGRLREENETLRKGAQAWDQFNRRYASDPRGTVRHFLADLEKRGLDIGLANAAGADPGDYDDGELSMSDLEKLIQGTVTTAVSAQIEPLQQNLAALSFDAYEQDTVRRLKAEYSDFDTDAVRQYAIDNDISDLGHAYKIKKGEEAIAAQKTAAQNAADNQAGHQQLAAQKGLPISPGNSTASGVPMNAPPAPPGSRQEAPKQSFEEIMVEAAQELGYPLDQNTGLPIGPSNPFDD